MSFLQIGQKWPPGDVTLHLPSRKKV